MADMNEMKIQLLSISARSPSLAELPPEVTWKILKYAALSMSTEGETIEVDFQDILTFLSSVCPQWNDIINDPERSFRKQFIHELRAQDPSQCLWQAAEGIELLNISTTVGQPFDVLGDELFVLKHGCCIRFAEVYDLMPLKSVPSATKQISLPQLRILDVKIDPILFIMGLKACNFNNCLYVTGMDMHSRSKGTRMAFYFRLSPIDGCTLARWTLPKDPMSVTCGFEMLTVCSATGCVIIPDIKSGHNHILEFNPDGVQTRLIDINKLLADASLDSGTDNDQLFVSALPNATYFVMANSMRTQTPAVMEIGLRKLPESEDRKPVILHGPYTNYPVRCFLYTDVSRGLYHTEDGSDEEDDGDHCGAANGGYLYTFGRDMKPRQRIKLTYKSSDVDFTSITGRHFDLHRGRFFISSKYARHSLMYFNLLRDDLE